MNALFCTLALMPNLINAPQPTIAVDPLIHFTPITQKGLVAKLTDKADLILAGQKVEILNDAKQTVTEISEAGDITVHEEDSNISIMVSGSPMPAPQGQTSTATMDKLGRLIKFQSGAADAGGSAESQARLFNLTLLIYPGHDVKPGEKWTAEVPANAKLGTKAVTASYTAEGIETVGKFKAIKVKFAIKEGGDGEASSSGTLWIDVKDGMTDKVIATVKDVSMNGVPGTVEGTLNSNRVE